MRHYQNLLPCHGLFSLSQEDYSVKYVVALPSKVLSGGGGGSLSYSRFPRTRMDG